MGYDRGENVTKHDKIRNRDRQTDTQNRQNNTENRQNTLHPCKTVTSNIKQRGRMHMGRER